MNKGIIKLFLICICLYLNVCTYHVCASELMEVKLTYEDGSKIIASDGIDIYAAAPLVFTPASDVDSITMYALSTDYGESFGGYVVMNDSSLTLYPDSEMNENNYYVIKFMSEKGDEKQYSREYHVKYDFNVPEIQVDNPQVLSGWIREESELELTCTDECGIGRVIASVDSKVIYEEHHVGKIEEAEPCTKKQLTLPLDEVSEGISGKSIIVIVTDLAGNSSETMYTYYLDKGVPSLIMSGVSPDSYITESCEIVLMPVGIYGENDYITYESICQSGDAILSKSASEVCSSSGMVIPIDQEGRYEIEAYTYDLAGNTSDTLHMSFVYDSNAPSIIIEGVADGVDYKDKVTVNVLIEEMMYETCNVSITAIRRKGGVLDNLPVSTYALGNCCDKKELSFVNDGDYELYVSAIDGANRTTSRSVKFRIDKNAPTLNISGINEGEVTSSMPKINIRAHEVFYDATIISSDLLKKDRNGKYESVVSMQNVMQEKDDQFQIEITEEGVYKLKCFATDRSGNCSEESLDFTVDYTPPVISKLTTFDGKFLDAFSVPTNIRGLISDSTDYTYEATLNDEHVESKSPVIEEGKYLLRISATDEAGNYSEEDAIFIIDHTAPQIVLSGVRKDGTIKKGAEIMVALNDYNDELSEVIVNDTPIELSTDHKTAIIKVNDYGDVCMKIKAFDAAGNHTDKNLYMNCVMLGNVKRDYVKKETIIRENAPVSKEYDIDFNGILVGLASVLTGTFGLVARVACME